MIIIQYVQIMHKIKALLSTSLLLLTLNTHAKGKHSAPRHLDITPNLEDVEPTLVLDVDTNIYGGSSSTGNINDIGSTIYVNPLVQYSFKNLDFQFQSLNVPIKGGGAQNYEHDNYVGMMHTQDVSEHIRVVHGSILGFVYDYTNLHAASGPIVLHNFNFQDWNYIQDNWLIHAGAFYVNKALSTTTDYTSFQCGFQYTLNNFLRFQGDYVAGHSNVSGATVTTTLLLTKHFNFRFGVIVPEHNSGNEFAGDVGLIYKY